MSITETTPQTPPAGAGNEDGGGGGDTTKPPEAPSRSFISRVLEGWKGFLTAAGAIGAAVVTYDLAKSLGKGEPDGSDHLIALVSIAAFAIGAGLLLTIPILLTARTRATLSDAVTLHKNNKKSWKWWRNDDVVVGRDVLYGHADVAEFYDEMNTRLTEMRSYWEHQPPLAAPAGLRQLVRTYVAQREEAQFHVAAKQVAAASRRAAWFGATGLLLAVTGYSNATWITNRAIRQGETADRATAVSNERIDSILAAALAEAAEDPGPGVAVPPLPSEVTVVFPDKATAASVLGVAEGDLDDTCWASGRVGTAYDLSASDIDDAPSRVIRVAFGATSASCGAVDTRIDPVWIQPEPEDGGGTSGTTTEETGGGETTETTETTATTTGG